MKEFLKKPYVWVIITVLLVVGVIGSQLDKNKQAWKQTPVVVQEFDISKIGVRFELQNSINKGKQKFVVFIENKSKVIFNGTLTIKSTEAITKRNLMGFLGSESVFVKYLLPGKSTYAILWIKLAASVDTEWEWSNIKVR